MYDMYSWDQPASSAGEPTEPGAASREAGRAVSGTQVAYASPAEHASRNGQVDGAVRASADASRAVQAVQVALDRRDNGGDAGSGRRG